MKISLQIEVNNATTAHHLVALAQLLAGGNHSYTFVFDEAMPAFADVLSDINSSLINTIDLPTAIELQKEIGDPMLLVRVQRSAERLIDLLKQVSPSSPNP